MEDNKTILDKVKNKVCRNFNGVLPFDQSILEVQVCEAYHQEKIKEESPNPNEGWIGWLCARIPMLNGNGSYRFWVNQAIQESHKEKVNQLISSEEKHKQVFDFFHQEHGLILTNEEIHEILLITNKPIDIKN